MVANYMHKIGNKSLWKDVMNYGSDNGIWIVHWS